MILFAKAYEMNEPFFFFIKKIEKFHSFYSRNEKA